MKWFKHDTNAHDNQKLQQFMAKHERAPLEAYGFYWMLLEIVSRQMDETDRCEIEYPTPFLARKFGISARKLREFLQDLCEIRAIDAEICAKSCKIKVPKLLEKRDEHTRKLRSNSQKTPAQDKEEDIDKKDTDKSLRSLSSKTSVLPDEKNPPENPPPEPEVEAEVDFKKIIFTSGLKWLAQRTGKPEAKLRPLVGKWCKHGEDRVAAALIKAQQQGAVDPVSFIQKVLADSGGGGGNRPKTRHSDFEKQDYSKGLEGFHVIE